MMKDLCLDFLLLWAKIRHFAWGISWFARQPIRMVLDYILSYSWTIYYIGIFFIFLVIALILWLYLRLLPATLLVVDCLVRLKLFFFLVPAVSKYLHTYFCSSCVFFWLDICGFLSLCMRVRWLMRLVQCTMNLWYMVLEDRSWTGNLSILCSILADFS